MPLSSALSSGAYGPEEMTATITRSRFEPNTMSEYDPNKLFLYWTVEPDEQTVQDFPEYDSIRYSIGQDWETFDDGKTIEHPRGTTRMNPNTNYGKVIERVTNMPEAVKVFEAREQELGLSEGQLYAPIWEGMTFKFQKITFEGSADRGVPDYSRDMPVEFMGVDGETAGGSNSGSNNQELVNELTQLANNSSSNSEFVKAASKKQEVINDDDLFELVTSGQFYKEAVNE